MRRAAWLTMLFVAIAVAGSQRPGYAGDQRDQGASPASAWKGRTHLVISAARANFPRLATWLFNGLYNEYPHREFTGEILFTGSGYALEIRNIEEGRAQLAVITPSATAYMAYHGVGLFSRPFPKLRGLFKIGQRDPIIFAVPQSLGISSFDEVIRRKIPLKVAAGFDDGDDTTGFLFREFLKASGTSIEELKSWGGQVVHVPTSMPGLEKMLRGDADSIFQEGMVVAQPRWKDVNAKTPMRVLSIDDAVLQKLARYGFRKFEPGIKKGRFAGVLEDVQTIDYADWIVVGDAALPDDVAYKIAKVAAETGPAWSAQDQNIHPSASGELGNQPVEPDTMWKDLGAPLHPGAERYYREKGLIK